MIDSERLKELKQKINEVNKEFDNYLDKLPSTTVKCGKYICCYKENIMLWQKQVLEKIFEEIQNWEKEIKEV